MHTHNGDLRRHNQQTNALLPSNTQPHNSADELGRCGIFNTNNVPRKKLTEKVRIMKKPWIMIYLYCSDVVLHATKTVTQIFTTPRHAEAT